MNLIIEIIKFLNKINEKNIVSGNKKKKSPVKTTDLASANTAYLLLNYDKDKV